MSPGDGRTSGADPKRPLGAASEGDGFRLDTGHSNEATTEPTHLVSARNCRISAAN